jgi:hypothetical protein
MDETDINLLQSLKSTGSRASTLYEHFDLIQEAWEVYGLGSPLITRALQEKGVVHGGSPSNVQAFIERQRKAGRLGEKGCRSGELMATNLTGQAKPKLTTKPATGKTNRPTPVGIPVADANEKMQALNALEKLFSDTED